MAVALSLLVKNPFRNARVIALTAVLLVGAATLLLREPRVSFLRPGLRLNAYVSTADGSVAVVAVDCQTHAIVARGRTGHEAVLARATPDGKSVLVVNRSDGTLGIHDAATLLLRGSVPVVAQPEDVAVMADSSVAFVLSRTEPRVSVVDLRRGVLLTNLQLAGKPSEMLLKPDGGELYVISPESHGLQAINTWAHEVGDYVLLGSAPTHGILFPDASEMFVTDTAAGRVAPVDINNRRVGRPISAGQAPGAMRFDSNDPDVKPSLLLVVNEGSGDLAVIGLRAGSESLLTMIPVGPRPQDLAVKLFCPSSPAKYCGGRAALIFNGPGILLVAERDFEKTFRGKH